MKIWLLSLIDVEMGTACSVKVPLDFTHPHLAEAVGADRLRGELLVAAYKTLEAATTPSPAVPTEVQRVLDEMAQNTPSAQDAAS